MKLKIFNYLQYFLKKRKKNIVILKKYSEYMENGSYLIKPYYTCKINTCKINFNPIFKNEKMNFILEFIYRKKIDIYSQNKKFNGELLYINAQNNIKIFSKNSVLTFLDKKNINLMLINNKEIQSFFNFPKILEIKNDYYIEEFIEDRKKIDTVELYEIYNLLLKFYLKQSYEFLKIDTTKILWEKLTTENSLFVKSLILDKEYIFVKSHNDIHFGNIIKNDKIYIIDWEYYEENLFFYDFINILFIEALKGNQYFLSQYFKGEFDEVFEKLFSLFKIEFQKESRMDYFNSYLLQKIIIRDMFEPKEHLNRVLGKYRKVKEIYC